MEFAFISDKKKSTGPTKKWTSKQLREEIAKLD